MSLLSLAHAATTCTLNGQQVPCDQVPGGAVVGILAIGFFVLMAVVGIAALVFWIKMLVHAIKHPIENKPLWIIILLLFGIIGAIVYYFAVKKHMATAMAPTEAMPPTIPPVMPPTVQ